MAVELVKGDILQAEVEAIVNPVNTVGVMGAGLAKQMRAMFPEMWVRYRKAYTSGELDIGRLLVCEVDSSRREGRGPRLVICFPTKEDWRDGSLVSYVHLGLEELVKVIERHRIRSIAIPALGCGLGGLRWETVLPLIEHALEQVPDVRALVFEPG